MRIIILFIMFASIGLQAQDEPDMQDGKYNPVKGKINVQLMTGINNTTPVGVGAKSIRNGIEATEDIRSDYSGSLLPKTSAYVGLTVDYQFHKVGAIGFGFIYTPKGFWLFEKNVIETSPPFTADKRKTFVTVDYFDIPLFYKEYLKNGKLTIRFGPVISLAVVSKVRIISDVDGEKEKSKYRLEEEGYTTFNAKVKPVVPGFEAELGFGNLKGLQGNVTAGFASTMFEDSDFKSFIARIGMSYTFSK